MTVGIGGPSVTVIDKGMERIIRELGAADGSYVKVGYPEEKDKKHDKAPMGVAAVAAIQEFGSDDVGIPARPSMGQAFDKNRGELNGFIAGEYGKVLEGKQDSEEGLNRIGVFFKGKVQKEIRDGGFVPNKPATIARKGSSVPLIDSGQMRQSVDLEVVMK
ncbi:MAG TPA: hypothetical protein VFW62_09245 [bacterium]|nr:hypothetical protein [bacterium]